MTVAFVSGIGALGLNLVTGYAGQVSLGHAFFLGLGRLCRRRSSAPRAAS